MLEIASILIDDWKNSDMENLILLWMFRDFYSAVPIPWKQ